jgi:hypothetical protein
LIPGPGGAPAPICLPRPARRRWCRPPRTRPIDRGDISTEATVAQVLISKYADHLPLYRKAERPITHLNGFTGVLQVDGYGSYRILAEERRAARRHHDLASLWS